MNKSLRKIIYWGGALSVYLLMVALVLCLLFELNWRQLFQADENHAGFSGILLPVGPDDGRLPGSPVVWDEFLQAGGVDAGKMNTNGFDGLQAVKNVADFSKGSVGGLFLSGEPSKIFRRGKFLLLLNNHGKVQIVDCENPLNPKISGALPYQHVRRMEMQGDIAYLQLGRSGAQNDKLAVVDLGNPDKPRELAQLDLPEQTKSFFILNGQLVVHTSSRGYKGAPSVHLYDFGEGFQLVFLGSIQSPVFRKGFLKHEEYLLLPDLRAGLHVCDFSDPLHPVVVASLDLPAKIETLAQYGDTVFALGMLDHIYVIDLHDPLHPALSTVVEEANHAASFVAYDNYLYYFTENGYLRIFDVPPSASLHGRGQRSVNVAGELMSMQNGDGYTLLGNRQGSLPAAVTNVLPLPGEPNVTDQLFWQGNLVVLDDDGLVQFFRQDKKASLELIGSLKLPPSQRWLAASMDRLYAGGESTISVIAKSDDNHFILSDQLALPGEGSWDAVVIEKTLCVAAGKDGVLCFSAEQPDRLVAAPGWMLPRHLESRIDVRQLTSSGGGRVLAAAGPAGLLRGRIDAAGQLQLDGFINLPSPIYALAVVKGFCLVSTGAEVFVVDIRARDSLQNLGKIIFPGVERFAVAAPDFWAGYVPRIGWSILPVPRLVSPGEAELLQAAGSATPSESVRDRYRLNLFNDHEVITTSGVLTLSSLSGGQATGGVNDYR